MTQTLRAGEIATDAPAATDAGLVFVGVIRTPWPRREDCPRQGDPDSGPDCRIEIDPAWQPALDGIEANERIEVYYWLHRSRRDLLVQAPGHGAARGTFALRSPVRPNPIGMSVVALRHRDGATLVVRGLDCLDGTPLLDLKPLRCPGAAR